ncbi:MAG: hypothetical protein ACJ8CB_25675 [Ktedonobacteraceae bacterium]
MVQVVPVATEGYEMAVMRRAPMAIPSTTLKAAESQRGTCQLPPG